jgi:hypothetical protein
MWSRAGQWREMDLTLLVTPLSSSILQSCVLVLFAAVDLLNVETGELVTSELGVLAPWKPVVVCLHRLRWQQLKDSSLFVIQPLRCRQFGHVNCDGRDVLWPGRKRIVMALGGDTKW